MTAVIVFIVLGLVGGVFLVWYSVRSSPDLRSREIAFTKLQSKLDQSISELNKKNSDFNRLIGEAEEVMDILKVRLEAAEEVIKKLAKFDEMVKVFSSGLSAQGQQIEKSMTQLLDQIKNLEIAVESTSSSIASRVKTFLQSQSERPRTRLEDEIEVYSQNPDTERLNTSKRDSLRSDPRLGVLGAR